MHTLHVPILGLYPSNTHTHTHSVQEPAITVGDKDNLFARTSRKDIVYTSLTFLSVCRPCLCLTVCLASACLCLRLQEFKRSPLPRCSSRSTA